MMFRGWFIILQTLNVAARFEIKCAVPNIHMRWLLAKTWTKRWWETWLQTCCIQLQFYSSSTATISFWKKTKPQNHSSTAKEWSGIAVANHQKVTFSRRPMFQDILLKWNQWALQRIFESPVCFCGCTTILCIRCLATPWFLTKKQFTWFGSALWKPNQIGLPGRNALMCGTNKRSQLSSNWRIQSETFSGS